MLNVNDVAREYRVSITTVYRLLRAAARNPGPVPRRMPVAHPARPARRADARWVVPDSGKNPPEWNYSGLPRRVSRCL